MFNSLYASLSLIKWGFLSGILLGISLAFTSPFLILKRNALFPHALTHIFFLSIVLASLISKFLSPILEFLFITIFTLGFSSLIWILRRFNFYEDTATSIVANLAMGLALIIAVKTSQYDVRLFSYLFGSLLGLTKKDFIESLIVFFLTLILFYKFYPLWIAQITDRELPGINFKLSNLFYLILITLQILIGIKLMGILLVSIFFVFSSSLCIKFTKSFKYLIFFIGLLNILGIVGGIFISIIWDIPFSGAMVIFMSLYIILGLIWSAFKWN